MLQSKIELDDDNDVINASYTVYASTAVPTGWHLFVEWPQNVGIFQDL